MSKDELQKILEEHKEWIKYNKKGKRANLSYADLSNADLSNADLSNADLSGVDLRGTNLRGVDLRYADLSNTNLRYTDLRGANLKYANLKYADLRDADLSNADLDYSCLPLWCGSLKANMDDKHIKQLLYHTLHIVKYSNNISSELKEKLLTEDNINIANEFHRAEECGFIKKEGDNND